MELREAVTNTQTNLSTINEETGSISYLQENCQNRSGCWSVTNLSAIHNSQRTETVSFPNTNDHMYFRDMSQVIYAILVKVLFTLLPLSQPFLPFSCPRLDSKWKCLKPPAFLMPNGGISFLSLAHF